MRDSYLALPTSGLATAGTVMLDWNISARIANIHQRQAKFEKLNLNAAEMIRLRNLVATIPPEAEILGAFGAAEPETRRTRGVANIDRYNERTDIASVYLSQVPGYLLHLLDGGQSDGLLIESEPDDAPYQPDALRSWFMVSYAALLKAIVSDSTGLGSGSSMSCRCRRAGKPGSVSFSSLVPVTTQIAQGDSSRSPEAEIFATRYGVPHGT
jgi:hypothetical protein